MKYKLGDWVLYKPEHGKIWKLCKITEIDMYNNRILYLKNLKAQKSSYSSYWNKKGFYITGNPTIIPIKKDTNIKNINIKTLVALYGNPKDKNINDYKFFQESKKYNIQINSKNKKLIDKILKIIEDEKDIELKKLKNNNTNIDDKFLIKEKVK